MDDLVVPKFMQCGMCHNVCKDPRILNCLHTFCLTCLNSKLVHEMNEGRKFTCPTCAAQVNIEGSCQSLKENLVYVNIQDLLGVDTDNDLYDVAEIEHLINLVDEKKSGMQVKLSCIERKYSDTSRKLEERKTQLEQVHRVTNFKVTTFFNDLKTRINDFLTRKENNVRDEMNQILENEFDVNRQERIWLDTMRTVLSETCNFINGVKVSTGSKATVALDVFEEMDVHFDTFDRKLSKINTDDLELEFSPVEGEIDKIFDMEVARVETTNTSEYRIGDNDTNAQDEQLAIDTTEPSAPDLALSMEPSFAVTAMYARTFRTTVQPDHDGYICGISWLDENHLVCVDRSNAAIKLCTTRGNIIAVKTFSGNATDLTKTKAKLNEQTFVMTLPEQRQLVQFGVKRTRNLYIKSQIRTEIGYVCLAYDRDYSKLVCCVTLPFGHPRIDVVNGNGSVYKTFVWSQLLEDPRSLVISEDGVMVVLDQKRKCLIFVSTNGQFLGLYKGTGSEPLRDPGYLCLDKNLNIYVTDSESHAIDIVRMDRTRMCRVQSDVELGMPREVDLLDGDSPKLAFQDVSYGNGYISIYDLSVPVATARLSSVDRQSSIPFTESEAPPLYSPLPQEGPSAPPMSLVTDGDNPPSYESIFGTDI